MSSLANAIKRKTHKERAQPAGRKKYGLLEKKKDYLERARDFHRKEDTIKKLQRKAEERNEDEFYFAMERAKTRDGVHDGRIPGKRYSNEEVRLMKTQDEKYLTTKATSEAKKVERMRASLHMIGMAPQNKHTVFVDDPLDAEDFSPEEYFQTPAPLLERSFNRPRKEQLLGEAPAAVGGQVDRKQRLKAERKKYTAYKELLQRQQRQQKLAAVAQRMAHTKAIMGKGRKRKLTAEELGMDPEEAAKTLPVYRWKKERKK